MSGIIDEQQPDLVVVACNTASTLLLPHLRSRFRVPFVGTVPAIKPACAISQTRMVSVLGTEATVQREYTQGLIKDFAAGCEVTLVGSASLAGIAEASLRLEAVDEAAIAAEIAPCFLEKEGRRTDVVVLACTHYPLLLERLVRLAPWPVTWLDPAAAIACRVVDLLGPAREHAPPLPANAVFSSGRRAPDALARFGIVPSRE
jgi:glutamate racemase